MTLFFVFNVICSTMTFGIYQQYLLKQKMDFSNIKAELAREAYLNKIKLQYNIL